MEHQPLDSSAGLTAERRNEHQLLIDATGETRRHQLRHLSRRRHRHPTGLTAGAPGAYTPGRRGDRSPLADRQQEGSSE
jgi:hypothetical protein